MLCTMLSDEARLVRLGAIARSTASLFKALSLASTLAATLCSLIAATLSASSSAEWVATLASVTLFFVAALRAAEQVVHLEGRAANAASVVKTVYSLSPAARTRRARA
jgi:hypothetical protein